MTLLKQQQHAEVTLCARLKLETNQRSSVPVLWRRLCKNPAFAKWLIHYFFLKPLLTFTSWEHRVIVQLMEGTIFHFDAAAHSGVFAAIIVTVCSLLFTKWEIYHSYQKWTMAIFSWNSFAGKLNGTGLSLLSLIPPMLLPDLKRICLLWQKLIISLFHICCSLLYLSESSRYKCVKHWPNLLGPPAPFQFTILLRFFSCSCMYIMLLSAVRWNTVIVNLTRHTVTRDYMTYNLAQGVFFPKRPLIPTHAEKCVSVDTQQRPHFKSYSGFMLT